MKIIAQPVDLVTQQPAGVAVTLGDDSAGDYIAGGAPQFRPAKTQLDDLAYGAEIARAARGNAKTEVHWVTSREHESIAAAFEFEWDHGAAVPAYCHLQFTEGGASRYLAFAVLTAVNETEPRTQSTKFSYAATGGIATGDAPAGMTDPAS